MSREAHGPNEGSSRVEPGTCDRQREGRGWQDESDGHIAAAAAESGWDVLVVDLDPQGNLGEDLGYRQSGLSDDGMALSKAVQFREPLDPPVKRVRPLLDVVPAGSRTRELARVLQDRGAREAARSMDAALSPLVPDYDLILFDCPPGDTMLGDLGLSMARGLVVPVMCDAGSLDGLEVIAARVQVIRNSGINPELVLLGIALFDVKPRATALRRQVEEELSADFIQGVRVFATSIRHSERAAFDMRRDGATASEYDEQATSDRFERLELLRRGSALVHHAGPAKSRGLQRAWPRTTRC